MCTSTIYNVHACTLSVPGKKHRPKGRGVLPYQVLLGDMQKGSCMITAKQYTDTYVEYKRMLRENSERIFKSTECRKLLIKNAATADPLDLLQEAVNCIYDLTGDRCFLKEVTEAIERRRQ